MLALKDITKIYETATLSVKALNGVSLAFRKSEFVCILGPSGCGKTTLLNVIGGLDRYTSGELSVGGKMTSSFTDSDWDSYRNHKIGFVFQSYNLIAHQTVLENVELALTLSGVNKLQKKRRAMKALESVGLEKHLHKKPNELSGGEMQRVAIARAIVNDPEIILADEPTGALDSKTSVQIMDLLKEISKNRLVIMVTHNDQLANNYASRIIRLLDGRVVTDSNPFKEETVGQPEKQVGQQKVGGKTKASQKGGLEEKKKERKTSMTFGVALSLSFKNLMTKKTRTVLTSLAASIGIIGLALVLALYNGLNVFLDKVQHDTLSSYPMSVTTSETTDIESYISIITDDSNYISNPNMKDKIFVSHLVTQLNETKIRNKITQDYLDFLQDVPKEYMRDISYDYGYSFNIFKQKITIDLSEFKQNGTLPAGGSTPSAIIIKDAKIPVSNYFKQMVGGEEFILSQYDLVAGKFPTEADELCLVLDKNNRITDTMLIAFLIDIMAGRKDSDGNFVVNEYDYEAFLGKDGKGSEYGTFTLALNDGYYQDSDNDGVYSVMTKTLKQYFLDSGYASSGGNPNESLANAYVNMLNSYGFTVDTLYSGRNGTGFTLDLKITGILRLKEQTTTGAMGAYPIGYTSKLTELVRADCMKSNVAKAQYAEYQKILQGEKGKNVVSGKYIDASAAEKQLKNLGYAVMPKTINFYATSFENKEALKKYLASYNNKEGLSDEEKIYVTDVVSAVIKVLQTFINTITYILLALTAISLLVAAIMIAIITYVSVIERTREIGILRSIGARKIDVTTVFNAETIIIGLFSGFIGILFAFILQFPLNAIMYAFTGISSLAALAPLHCLILVLISVLVTLLSGMIPAIMAARRDPVKALRAE